MSLINNHFSIVSFLLSIIVGYVAVNIPVWYADTILSLQTFFLKTCKLPLGYWVEMVRKWIRPSGNPKRRPKGLVGVIETHIDRIEPAQLDNNATDNLYKIHFAEEDGDYYARNTHLDKSEIEKQVGIIRKYYSFLQKEINTYFPDDDMFFYEELSDDGTAVRTSIVSKVAELYSQENIQKYIDKVNSEMSQNNAIYFIGDKLGIKSFDYVRHDRRDGLRLYIYKTDHFTWQVFKEIFKDNKPLFQELILRVNQTGRRDMKKISYIVKCLAFLFSSVGIDIIVHSTDCKKKRNMIIAARNGNIERDGMSKLHVSVNETFSRTDSVASYNNQYSLYDCVRRGIEEELGIPQAVISDDMINFHDFAIVTDEGEIGFSCYVDISSEMPIEQTLMYPGQDKFIENKDLLSLPYFSMNGLSLLKSVGSKKYMRKFYASTLDDCMNLPWMSFAPLLISRVMIRNIPRSRASKIATITLPVISGVLLAFVFKEKWVSIITGEFLGFLKKLWGWCKSELSEKHKFRYVQPFVSQWHGNVSVIQANGHNEPDVISEGIKCSLLSGIKSDDRLSDLNLAFNPYVSVRVKRSANNYGERPISYFCLEPGACDTDDKSTLKLYAFNLSTNSEQTSVVISCAYTTDSARSVRRIKSFRFGSELSLSVGEFLSFDNGRALEMTDKKMYRLSPHHETISEGTLAYGVAGTFSDQYNINDLFKFKNDYYLSLTSIQSNDLDLCKNYMISGKANGARRYASMYDAIYNAVKSEKEDEGVVSVRISGKGEYMEKMLSEFISNPNNKRKIPELEIYMLQFMMIRSGILLADLEYRNPPKVCIVDN